jgi:hypothetical protein
MALCPAQSPSSDLLPARRRPAPIAEFTFGWLAPEELQADPELDELIAAQYREFGTLVPDPDWNRLQNLCRIGFYRVWAAKQNGEIVAWVEFNVGPHFHYAQTKCAWDCGHYCRPEYRPWLHIKLWRSALLALQDIDVTIVIGHSNRRKPLDTVFKRLGFEPAGQMYEITLPRKT